MPAKPSGKIKKSTIRSIRKNGDIYLLERETEYDPEKKYNKVISTRLISKIPKGTENPVPTRPKLANGEKGKIKSGIIDATRKRIGMTAILNHIGQVSGIDNALYASTDIGTAQKIISLARYWVATEGASLPGIVVWQYNHKLPYEDGLSEDIYHDLFTKIGYDEKLQQQFFKARSTLLSLGDSIAYDSTTISTYSTNQIDARRGFNKDGDGLNTIKFLVLYSINQRQPIAFTLQPGNLPDVTSITNAINQLSIFTIKSPEMVTDGGYYGEMNLSELFQAGIDFITLADKDVTWIRSVIDANRDKFTEYSAYCPGDPTIAGITVHFMHTFIKEQKYGSQKKNMVAGDTEEFDRKVYLHIYFNEAKRASDRENLIRDLQYLQHEIEDGVPVDTFSKKYQKMVKTYFTIRKWGDKIKVLANDEAIRNALPYHGFFVLISSRENDTWKCLRKYRRRNTIESFFEADKGRADGKKPRVWNAETLRGRMFVQFIALSYYEYLNELIRNLKSTLGKKTGDSEHDKKKVLGSELNLKSWLENTPLYLQLQWFDAIEGVDISTKLAHKRWNTETTERDRLYLEKLGVTLKQ